MISGEELASKLRTSLLGVFNLRGQIYLTDGYVLVQLPKPAESFLEKYNSYKIRSTPPISSKSVQTLEPTQLLSYREDKEQWITTENPKLEPIINYEEALELNPTNLILDNFAFLTSDKSNSVRILRHEKGLTALNMNYHWLLESFSSFEIPLRNDSVGPEIIIPKLSGAGGRNKRVPSKEQETPYAVVMPVDIDGGIKATLIEEIIPEEKFKKKVQEILAQYTDLEQAVRDSDKIWELLTNSTDQDQKQAGSSWE